MGSDDLIGGSSSLFGLGSFSTVADPARPDGADLIYGAAGDPARLVRGALTNEAPGFGSELAEWLRPVTGGMTSLDDRLLRALCHLADVSWRAHPEFRTSAVIEAVTRTNVSSAGHRGRAFMAAALPAIMWQRSAISSRACGPPSSQASRASTSPV